MKTIKKFTLNEFYFVLELIQDSVRIDIFFGRGRKCVDSEHDLLFILFVTIKRGEEWYFLLCCFRKMFRELRKQ